MKITIFLVNWAADFFENVKVSKSKFERIVFELFNFNL